MQRSFDQSGYSQSTHRQFPNQKTMDSVPNLDDVSGPVLAD
jgi:hypothetical protein